MVKLQHSTLCSDEAETHQTCGPWHWKCISTCTMRSALSSMRESRILSEGAAPTLPAPQRPSSSRKCEARAVQLPVARRNVNNHYHRVRSPEGCAHRRRTRTSSGRRELEHQGTSPCADRPLAVCACQIVLRDVRGVLGKGILGGAERRDARTGWNGGICRFRPRGARRA